MKSGRLWRRPSGSSTGRSTVGDGVTVDSSGVGDGGASDSINSADLSMERDVISGSNAKNVSSVGDVSGIADAQNIRIMSGIGETGNVRNVRNVVYTGETDDGNGQEGEDSSEAPETDSWPWDEPAVRLQNASAGAQHSRGVGGGIHPTVPLAWLQRRAASQTLTDESRGAIASQHSSHFLSSRRGESSRGRYSSGSHSTGSYSTGSYSTSSHSTGAHSTGSRVRSGGGEAAAAVSQATAVKDDAAAITAAAVAAWRMVLLRCAAPGMHCHFDAQQLSNTAYALARLGFDPGPEWWRVYLLSTAALLARQSLADGREQQQLGQEQGQLQGWQDNDEAEQSSKQQRQQPSRHSSALQGGGQGQQLRQQGQARQSLATCPRLPARYEPRHLASTLWALARLRHTPPSGWLRLLESVLIPRLSECSAQVG